MSSPSGPRDAQGAVLLAFTNTGLRVNMQLSFEANTKLSFKVNTKGWRASPISFYFELFVHQALGTHTERR